MIVIEYEVDTKKIEDGSTPAGQVYQEINGTLINSYIDDGKLNDDKVMIKDGDFSEVGENSWSTSPSKLTKGKLGNFKVKNVVGIGPYGMYTNEEGQTVIKAPINRKGILPVISGVNITDNGNFIDYELQGDLVMYENIRISFSDGELSFDFIVKDREGQLSKPFEMNGNYTVTCIGYRDEIENYSEPSDEIEVSIESRL